MTRARPLLWLRLTPHRMSHRRVLLSTAMSSLSLCLPMGSRLSLTEPCTKPKCSCFHYLISEEPTFTMQRSRHETCTSAQKDDGFCSNMSSKDLTTALS